MPPLSEQPRAPRVPRGDLVSSRGDDGDKVISVMAKPPLSEQPGEPREPRGDLVSSRGDDGDEVMSVMVATRCARRASALRCGFGFSRTSNLSD